MAGRHRRRAASRRRATRQAALLAAVPLGLLASAGLVWQSSYAAFTATTTNTGSSWSSGTVALADDDGGSTALFSVTNLKPGSSGSRCIRVSYTGTVESDVRLSYGTGGPDLSANPLAPHIALTVEVDSATDASFAGCGDFAPEATLYNGTLRDFSTSRAGWATSAVTSPAAAEWKPTGPASRVYRFSWVFASTGTDAGDNALRSQSVNAVPFTWEARST